jgi:superfamily I DNA/RNA helicase
MFIVGDAHQRIYDNHVSLARVGINVRGRNKRLTVNYRTTQEILALAVPALGKASVTGLDDEADTLTGYRSPLHGRRPKVVAARTREAEYEAPRAARDRLARRGHRTARDRRRRPVQLDGKGGRRRAQRRRHPYRLAVREDQEGTPSASGPCTA